MQTPWIPDRQLSKALERNEAYWRGELEDGPLLWVTAPGVKPGKPLPPPACEDEIWTNVDYAISEAENQLSRTHFAGDALPFHNPWLGPDQFAAWLGADLTLRPNDYTSWVKPFVEDWNDHPSFRIQPENRWWRLYLQTLRESVRAGKGKWVTTFPDLHTGIDALSAIRSPQRLLVDLVLNPEPIRRAMAQMTALWKDIVDLVTPILLSEGQGSTNWTGGWSSGQFVCIGQNDFTCMISPEMFDEFCLEDTVACVEHVEHSLYHLDGPEAIRHLPRILEIEKLHTVQWVHGNGRPPHSHWIDLLKQIQSAGKAVQVWYNLHYTTEVVNVFDDAALLCAELDPNRLFIGADVASAGEADALVNHALRVSRNKQPTRRVSMS
jgi:succinate dehydrogenase flavin-adding protein (antitoxin of CptAB toxin-antitoxin module)